MQTTVAAMAQRGGGLVGHPLLVPNGKGPRLVKNDPHLQSVVRLPRRSLLVVPLCLL